MLEQLSENSKMQEKQHELEEFTEDFVKSFNSLKAGETRTIPVHVIVIYANSNQNISEAQIQSQIDVMNLDYGGTNSDLVNVPSDFTSVTSQGTGIQFYLSGIERHSDNTSEWGTNDAMKTAYPPTSPSTTLNMWICNIGSSILGYAQFPGGAASTDGVVFSPQYCGSSDYDDGSFYLSAPFDKGRTCTHEVGHYLNLRHIWGDGGCSASDYVDDTPSSDAANYNCPSHPDASCNSNDMFMNYMDYVDDECMYMFSDGQSARMWACLNSSRLNLGTSDGNIDPTADANGPYTGDANVSISFSSTGSDDSDGSIASYAWSFGDGATSTSANPSHSYSADGIYTVTLTVTDNEGATGSASTTATIGDVCSGTQACDGNISMTLVTDKYASETSWTLKNSAGTTVESSATYSNNTTYNLSWTLTEDTYTFAIVDSYGDGICCSYGSGSYTITDGCSTTLQTGGSYGSGESFDFCVPEGTTPTNEDPTAEANGPYSSYEDVAISFSSTGTNDSDGTISTYAWTFGDGGTSSSANPSYTYTTTGTYTATLTVTDNDGATDSDQATVTISEAPTCIDVTLTLVLDNYPEETSWAITNSGGTTVASGGTYANQADGSTVTVTECLDPGSYTFTINDSYGDGICCSYGSGSYSLADASGTVLASGGSFSSSETTNFNLSTGRNTMGVVRTNLALDENRIYPNPTGDIMNIHLIQGYVITTTIISANGQIIKKAVEGNKVDVSDLTPGLYFVNIYTDKKIIKTKFIKE